MKLKTRSLFRSISKGRGAKALSAGSAAAVDIKWELRPGGMLVQKRDDGDGEDMIRVRVSDGIKVYEISVKETSSFRELKAKLYAVTGLEPAAQRILYRGKEREDGDYLHMTGVRDMDKMLMLEDPAAREMKMHGMKNMEVGPLLKA